MNPGGFCEHASTAAVRPRPTITLPARGRFTFPAPWNTIGIRLTHPDDMGGGDALWPTGYSYWQAINTHVGQPVLRVFLGLDRNRGGCGPALYEVDKASDAVRFLGPLFPPEHPLSWATGEGWYWSRREPDLLYVSDLHHLFRYNVVTQALETVVDTLTSDLDPSGTKVLWQWHSSDDGRVHSCTLKDGTSYRPEGAIVYREGAANPWSYFPATGDLDECHVDLSGEWLLIKDNVDAAGGEDNRMIRLATGHERILLDQEGAAGHSDNGWGYVVAADNWNDKPGAYRVWMFDPNQLPQGVLCYHTPSWEAESNHVAHGNAVNGPPASQYVIASGASRTPAPRNGELIGFRLDGSLEVLVIAPSLVDLDAPGGGDDYAKLPKANVDGTGTYALWTSNWGGPRLDAFLVKIPSHLLTGHDPTPLPCTHACPVHCPA